MTTKIIPISCGWYCFCLQFSVSGELWAKIENMFKNKDYRKRLVAEVQKENPKVTPNFLFFTLKEKNKKEPQRVISFRLTAKALMNCEDFSKTFPPIQERVAALGQLGIKDFEATSCGEFNFNLKVFSPVGQFSLPTDLPLNENLTEKLGKTKLVGFAVSFENSPLGLNKVEMEIEDKEVLSVSLNSSFKSESLENFVHNAYKHLMEIAKLFVVEKNGNT